MVSYEAIFCCSRASIFTVDALEAEDYLHNLTIECGPWYASYMSFWLEIGLGLRSSFQTPTGAGCLRAFSAPQMIISAPFWYICATASPAARLCEPNLAQMVVHEWRKHRRMSDRTWRVSVGCIREKKGIAEILLVIAFLGRCPHPLRCRGSRAQSATFTARTDWENLPFLSPNYFRGAKWKQ